MIQFRVNSLINHIVWKAELNFNRDTSVIISNTVESRNHLI